MQELSSCKTALENCIEQKYFAIAHLYKEEKSMKMHVHDCHEIYYSITGGKQFLIDNKFYSIEQGDIFVISQFESHYLTQIDSQIHERIVLSVHPDFVRSISSKQTSLSYIFDSRDSNFSHRMSLSKDQQKRFLYFINKILSAGSFGRDILEKAVFSELMLFLNGIYYDRKNTVVQIEETKYNKQVDDILSYINSNLHESITIEGLSSHFYLSDSYICRIFKSTTGMTINKYVTARRISIAKSLLSDGLSVNDVCEQCGYNDYSNFVKSFTKTVGISPKKYALFSNQ